MNSNEPIAIVGYAFRFPGDLDTEDVLWQALKNGRDLVTQVPADRWATEELQHNRRKEPGRSITFSAGVRSRIDEFDAGFFGISPREAAWMDPQQRMLLELAWEALENAGQKPTDIAGSACAVYVGISSLDYGVRAMDDLASISPNYMTGNTLSIAANRLSYVLDLRGPSVSVDTACSSSLVALHHACNSLRTGEASAALVGGINLLLHPYPFIGFTKAAMLSDYGRCRAFDASGAGYVRGEGGAVLMLKPLSKAKADGDAIHALILASGINADGAQKTGITIPSAEGQQALMRAVLERSGINPADIDYIEAHGTGTAVGDPVETAAIGAVYGRDRSRPLPIGSVKTNLGHMEAASGMGGLMKAILAIKHRAIPPTIHCQTLNPKIDFDGLNLHVAREFKQIDKAEAVRIGVNSFGFGGANAHVILQSGEGALASKPSDDLAKPLPPLFLSARSEQALNHLAAAYADLIDQQAEHNIVDIAYSAITTRDWLPHRLVVPASTQNELVQKLRAIAQGDAAECSARETGLFESGGIGFVYSGNGSQWHGMGRKLLQESPEFVARFAELDGLMREPAGFSILEAIESDNPETIADTVFAQPLLFAVQVCVTQYLKSVGIKPLAATGHSVGEVASAWASGALTLEQAIRVICARSQAQGLMRGAGRMAAVAISADEAIALIKATGSKAELGGINSPNNVTLSGSLQDLEKIQKALDPRGIFFKLLDLDYAFHSLQMDPIRETLAERLQGLTAQKSTDTAYVSTVTGTALTGQELGADYWWDNIRQPVQFESAIATMADLGCRVFLEIGPNAILQRYISETLAAKNVSGKALPALTKQRDDKAQLTEAALRAQLLAEPFDPWAWFPEPGQRVQLPNYPWQRERYWHPQTVESQQLIQRCRVHPLLGWRLNDADFAWENTPDTTIIPWLADHNVGSAVVFPGAAYAEMALAAAKEWLGQPHLALKELDILSPLTFDEGHARQIRLDLNPRDGGVTIRSRQRLSESEWSIHAVGRIVEANTKLASPVLTESTEPITKTLSAEQHYALTEALGLVYGPSFRGIDQVSLGETTLQIQVNNQVSENSSQYLLPPAVLDLCFQSLVDYFDAQIQAGEGVAYLPVKVEKLTVYSQAPITQIRGRLLKQSRRSALADFELFDAAGQLVAKASGCRFRAAPSLIQQASDIGIWQQRLQLAPRPNEAISPDYPAVTTLADAINEHLEAQSGLLNRHAWHAEHRPLMDALALATLYEAFQKLFAEQPGTAQQLCAAPELATEPLVRWATHCLQQESLLTEANGHWSLAEVQEMPSASAIWQVMVQEAPTALPQLLALARVGQALPAVLSGQLPLAALKESIAQSTIADNLLDETPAYTGTRLMLEEVARQLVESVPANRQCRVLLLSPVSNETAHPEWAIFKGQPNISVKALSYADWQASADQATASDIQDLIILRHALHQDSNPRAAIARLYGALSAGGMLLVAEQGASWAQDLLAGLDANWWCEPLNTNEAPVSSLNAASVWQEAFEAEGFLDVQAVHEPAADALNGAPYLLIAQKPLTVMAATTAEAANPIANKQWLLLVDEASAKTAHDLAQRLQQKQLQVEVQSADQINTLPQADKIVSLLGWNSAPESAGKTLANLLKVLQSAMPQTGASPQFTVVTRGALTSPTNSAISGMVRVAMNEAPQLGCKLIDLTHDLQGEQQLQELCTELTQPDAQNEVVLTANGRYALLLVPGEVIAPPESATASEPSRYKLDFTPPGQLRNLAWFAEAPKALAPNDVEIETKAVGLNFRDVMYTMGMLRDEAVENGFAGSSLGLEFAGVIKNVGSEVHDFKTGQAVMGFGAACFASHIVTTANAIAPMPEGWSFESAATVPTTFFTVYYALKHLANLQPGERVLIHGAAGGVGIAAIQLAQHLGAEIYATAGTDEKRDFVRMLGVDHVYDSRNLDFAEEILADTQGEGVDVVLNSLAGEAIRRNLQVLKPFGRFLELGKRDFFENTPIGLRPFKDNISYFGIDADQLLNGRQELAAKLFGDVMALFQEGVLYPLPHRAFGATQVVEAFRAMQQSRHIGKIVISMSEAPQLHEVAHKVQPIQLDNNSTWLVTGGVSGFGLASAQWLASRGAGHLVLINRRGMATPGAEAAIESINALGATAQVVTCDITDRAALTALIQHVQATQAPPIKGVLHAAAHFDDALITALNAERLNTVLAPKLQGAWHLHELTQHLPLDHFVLYSSVTTAIGNPAQANYVAANSALEGLAQQRHSQGLPAIAIGWGPIADAGYLTRNEAVKDSLAQRLGKVPLAAAEALNQLDWLLKAKVPQITIANFDWASLARVLPSANSPRFAELNRTQTTASHSADDIQSLLQGKTLEEVEEIIGALIAEEVSRILSIPTDRIEPTKSLHDLGMDSLMAVELALGLEQRFKLQLPAMMLNDAPTLQSLGARIGRMLTGDAEAVTSEPTVSATEALLKQHGESLTGQDLHKVQGNPEELAA